MFTITCECFIAIGWTVCTPIRDTHTDIDLYISECSAQGQILHYKLRNIGCSYAEGKSSTANSGTKAAVLLGMNRRGSFSLLPALHSLFSIWRDLKKSEKISGAPTWRWGEWVWLTGPSGLHRISPLGLNISSIRVFDQIRDPEIPITLRSLYNGIN